MIPPCIAFSEFRRGVCPVEPRTGLLEAISLHDNPPSAVVDSRATVHPTAVIGPQAVIDGPVVIGAGCEIGPAAVVMGETVLGANCRVHSHAVLGDLPQDRTFDDGHSSVRIGSHCVIREGVTIHRGTEAGTATVIGDRCMLMTNSHVGHNCVLGDDVTMISGSLLGGYVEVGDRAIISGNAAVHQFVRIGELAMISGLGKITRDIPPFFMTDRDGAIVGVNFVGLIRAKFTHEERLEIKAIHRHIYRLGLKHEDALAMLAGEIHSPAGRRLLAFLSNDSARGLTKGTARRRKAA